MTRRYANPLGNPLHYSTVQPNFGPPVSTASANRNLLGYDYVIIGCGTAGSVLASKLSEDPKVSVLVLEAGGNSSMLETKAPLLFSKLFHTEHDWDYSTVPQQNIANRKLYWPRGRMLGGSSSMNAMIYHHCSKSDFDEWSNQYGCTGWGYNDIAPYFRRMENFTANPSRPAINLEHRGIGGDWQTGYSYLSEIVGDGFLPACVEAGIAANEDINTVNGTIGVTRLQTFIDSKGQRSSMATAYLPNAVRQRPNLYIATHAHVTRVLFDTITTDTPTAIGVEFQTKKGGEKYQVHAKREVILASGAINTPQLLKLSGIGPADELKQHNIALIKENEAVGQNLKDHLCGSGIMCKTKPGYSLDYLTSDIKAIPALIRWLITGGGPLSSNVGEAAAFVRVVDHLSSSTSAENKPKDYGSGGVGPDIELVCASMAYIHHGEESARPGESVFGLVPISLRPQSSGTVTLKSDDPFEHPIIDPKYLSDKDGNDRKVLLAGLRVVLQVIRSPSLAKFLEPVETDDDIWSYWWPYSSSDIDKITDDQLQRWLVEKAFTLYHPIGTARMGSDPATSVVDTECKVHGVQGLRVMDASVFPEQVSGHPTAPIGAMAYKLSDMIKRDAEAVKPNL